MTNNPSIKDDLFNIIQEFIWSVQICFACINEIPFSEFFERDGNKLFLKVSD